MSFDGYPTPGHYILAKQREAEFITTISAIIASIVILIIIVAVFSFFSEKQVDGLTKQQAETEYCKLVNTLKYPDSSTATIDRLCYLEQIGKELAN